MKIYKYNNYFGFFALISLALLIFIMPMWQHGIIVGGDFIFPYTNAQLGEFYREGNLVWGYSEIPTGTNPPHNNLFPIQLIAGVFYSLGFDGVEFQKILITFIMLIACIFSYKFFLRVSKNNSYAAFIASTIYIFSSAFYNYFSMGWVWVLLFMALIPLVLLLVQNYFKYDDFWSLVLLGLLTSFAFLQSQAVVWVSILIICYAISIFSFDKRNVFHMIKKTALALTVVLSVVLIVHISWIGLLFIGDGEVIVGRSLSGYDSTRFNSTDFLNLIRGWGSIFNSQYELAYNPNFGFVALILPLIIVLQFFYKDSGFLKYKILSLLLVLVPFFMFLIKDILPYIPFSSIIRDLNRFIILSHFGFAISVSILFAQKKMRLIVSIVLSISLFFLIHPFINGELFNWSSQQGKGQSVRFLDIPQNQIEGVLKKYARQKNVLLPTGGHIGSINNPYYKNTYSEIADFDSYFSPYASGIYTSDKSSGVVSRFARKFIEASMNPDGKKISVMMKLYGIDNIFMRTDLFSSYNREFDYLYANYPFCKEITYKKNKSDFSIDRVCSVDDVYPLIFSPTSAWYSEDDNFIDNIELPHNKRPVVVSCAAYLKENNLTICPNNIIGDKAPEITFIEQEEQRYLVKVTNITSDYMIVLNQTFHDGWNIVDATNGQKLHHNKILVNDLVNGWVIPKTDGINQQAFILEYKPQFIYLFIRNISIVIFFCLLLISLYFSTTIKIFNRKANIINGEKVK
jgi:hypothetical protein